MKQTNSSCQADPRPRWYLDYLEAWKRVSHDDSNLDSWQSAYDDLFVKGKQMDDGKSSDPCLLPISFPIADATKRKAFETILKNNSYGLALDTPIFHYTTFSYLNEAMKRGGFILSQPKDWSVQWEDSVFKNCLKEYQEKSSEIPTIPELLVSSYMRDSYGMCWTLDDDNPCISEMFKRKHPSESIAVISSTVRQLLSAYITDNLSVKRCCLVRMRYRPKEEIKKSFVNPEDLYIGYIGTDIHHDSISITSDKFADQNEVRLIVEDDPTLTDTTTIQIQNKLTGHTEIKMIKHINLASVINSVRMIQNEYVFGFYEQGASR